MTRLLISVRDADEAIIAREANVGIVDVKEPRLGSLGAASPNTVEQVLASVDRKVPVSVACGELTEWIDLPDQSGAPLPLGVQYAKIGLAGCRTIADWRERWLSWRRSLPTSVLPVAVQYADWQQSDSPSPNQLLQEPLLSEACALLIDTFHKDGRSTFDHLSTAELTELLEVARQHSLFVVLAGSLNESHLPAIGRWRPDYLAVRGAVCQAGRESRLDAGRLTRLVAKLSELSTRPSTNRSSSLLA